MMLNVDDADADADDPAHDGDGASFILFLPSQQVCGKVWNKIGNIHFRLFSYIESKNLI